MTNQEKPKPWERQKNEPNSSFIPFNEFLKIGSKRTLKKVRVRMSESEDFDDPPSLSSIENKSARWNWIKRAEAYDDYRIAYERETLEARAHERLMKRIEQNEKEEDALHSMIMAAIGADTEELKITQKAYAVDCFSKAKKNASDSQRLDFGEPTSIQQNDNKHRIEGLDKSILDPKLMDAGLEYAKSLIDKGK